MIPTYRHTEHRMLQGSEGLRVQKGCKSAQGLPLSAKKKHDFFWGWGTGIRWKRQTYQVLFPAQGPQKTNNQLLIKTIKTSFDDSFWENLWHARNYQKKLDALEKQHTLNC